MDKVLKFVEPSKRAAPPPPIKTSFPDYKLLDIPSSTIGQLRRLFSKLPSGENPYIEFEVRIGKFENGSFISGVSKETFERLLRFHYQNKNWQNVRSETSKMLYYPNRIRQDLGTREMTLKVMKEKIDIADYGLRIALSTENFIDYNDHSQISELDRTLATTRFRKRTSFTSHEGFRIDFTEVSTEKKEMDDAITSYEIEIEFLRFDIDQSFFLHILNQFVCYINDSFYATTIPELETAKADLCRVANSKLLENVKGSQPRTACGVDIKNYFSKFRYAVTEKMDGHRAYLYVWRRGMVFLLHNRTGNPSFIQIGVISNLRFANSLQNCLAEGELCDKLYLFDLLAYQGRSVRGDAAWTLSHRLDILKELTDQIPSVSVKDFHFPHSGEPGVKKLFDVAASILDQKKDCEGLIFVPIDMPYSKVSKWPELIKWKRLHTVDLRYERGVVKMSFGGSLEIPLRHPRNFEIDLNDLSDVEGKVVEFDITPNRLKAIKVRHDKKVANHVSVVLDNIYCAIEDVLTEDVIRGQCEIEPKENRVDVCFVTSQELDVINRENVSGIFSTSPYCKLKLELLDNDFKMNDVESEPKEEKKSVLQLLGILKPQTPKQPRPELMGIVDLKKFCKENGLVQKGSKSELIDRVSAFLKKK